MVASGGALSFYGMSEAELRRWVEANSGRINDRDRFDYTPPMTAAMRTGGLSLIVWLLDEKGADVNATTAHDGKTALYHAHSLDILITLPRPVALARRCCCWFN